MNDDITRIIKLSDLLAKCEEIKRKIKLPHGSDESDSHHAFSLAMIAYDICKRYKLKLNLEKVIVYALVHDLLEIITGDEATLNMTNEQLEAKRRREHAALKEFEELMSDYPDLLAAFHDYERLDTPEAATVFVLDKTCTIWTHFHDTGSNLKAQGIMSRDDIRDWHTKAVHKICTRLQVDPPPVILQIFEDSYKKMHDELF